jgi:hypothetical protein
LANINYNINDLKGHIEALRQDHQGEINDFIQQMKEKHLENLYNDPELAAFWENSRKNGVAPGVDTPIDQMIEQRNKLFNKINDTAAEKPEALAHTLGLGKEFYDLKFNNTYENIRENQRKLGDLKVDRYDLGDLYEEKSKDLWFKNKPLYSNLDFTHESHLPGAKNPILHNRFKDRNYVDPETGKELKILSHEEQQSDLSKYGDRNGFYDPFVERDRQNKLTALDQMVAEKGDKQQELFNDYIDNKKAIEDKYSQLTIPIEREFNNSKKLQSDVDKYNNAYDSLTDRSEELRQARENYNNAWDRVEQEYQNKIKETQEQLNNLLKTKPGVPLVPYMGEERAHHELGLKSALKEALEGGYDRIFIPGAAEHARRYQTQLRQAIDDVTWNHDPFDATKTDNRFVSVKLKGSDRKETFLVEPVPEDGKTKYIVKESSLREAIDKPLSYVLGNDLSKKIVKDQSGNIPMENYVMGSEGYKSLYEEKLPARYKHILNQYFGKDAGKVYAGGMPDPEGEIVNGYFVDITPQMIQNYNSKKNKAGFFFYGYKRGGYVPPKNQDALKIANRVR